MKLGKPLAVVGLVAVVAAVAVGGTALAQTPTPTPNQQAKSNYLNVFMDKLASALGIDRGKLDAAVKTARDGTVDQAVADGKLSQDQANRIKSQQGLQGFAFGFGRGGHKGMPGPGMMGGGAELGAVANALGMSTQDLMTQLRSGKTLHDVAASKGKSDSDVKAAMVTALKSRLDPMVASGKITQAQEDQAVNKLQNLDLTKVGGFTRGFGRGGAPRQLPKPTPTPGTI